MIEPLPVRPGLVIPAESLSVSFTRTMLRLDDSEREVMDGVEAARRQPSAVELRCNIRECPVLDEVAKAKILAWAALKADRKGVVRTACAEYESRPKNLGGARDAMAYAIREALEAAPPETPPADAPIGRPKRGRGGLFKPAKKA